MTVSKTPASSRFRYLLFAAVSTAAIAAGVAGFSGTHASESDPAEAASSAPNVTVAKPDAENIVEWDEFTGRFAAIDSVEIRARVSGYLEAVAFEDGVVIQKGDLLFKIDPRPFEAELAAAKADLASAAAARRNAKEENERGHRLLERSALSKEEADRRESALRQADAAWAAANARVKQAELNLEFTEIRAPITGRISDNFVSEGNLIVGGAQGGTLLTRIVSLDPMYFEFTANEADYLKYVRLSAGGDETGLQGGESPVFVKLLDEADFIHEGRMSFVDNRFDPSTGTMRGRATFDNPDGVLTPGMFGRLKLAGSVEYTALLIPDSAVQTDQNIKFVWVTNDENVVERREVELGPLHGGRRIIRAGLQPSDRVIVSGSQYVMAGLTVAPLPETQTRLAAAR
ncbi:efflux RND transporter periplasmic adaptor subunit [Hyphococcus sp.]|uniref:efflux RND transporter periplasmic adaptor subunit n=1 Tax=Hyphococcus sp. TaxID=2038636 RepID=UPI003D0B9047